MLNKDNIDQKIFLNLTNKYYDLYERGKITEDQLENILELIENHQDYHPDDFQKKIKSIFEE